MEKNLGRYHQQRRNARRGRGKQIIYEESEEYRRDERALEYTSIDLTGIREVAAKSCGNEALIEKASIPLNKSILMTLLACLRLSVMLDDDVVVLDTTNC